MKERQQRPAPPYALRLVTAITLARAPLILLFVVGALFAEALQHDCQQYAWLPPVNLAILVLASLTDLWDGMLARRWRVTTPFGAVIDPLMDKVFYMAVFPTLTLLLAWEPSQRPHAILMLFFTISYLLRDQWVTCLRALASGQSDLRANWSGKLRTAISFPVGCLIYLHIVYQIPSLRIIIALEVFALAINVISWYIYTKRYSPALRASLKPSAQEAKPPR